MKYRIVKKTYANGSSWYYIQEKVLFFWINSIKGDCCGIRTESIGYGTEHQAKEYIQMLLNREKNNTVVKTEILK